VCTDPATAVDFNTSAYVEKPNMIPINYTISRPYGTFNATMTIKFYTPLGALAYTESTVIPYNGTPISGTYNITSANIPIGYYRVEVTFNVMNICNKLEDVVVNRQTMVVNPNSVPCVVFPGDVNNDGLVNYGDRASLNTYIYDANNRATWLVGPARYIANASAMAYMNWTAQAGIPWDTPQGCYMDADGNGYVNNFDYVAVKLNWMHSHGSPKTSIEQEKSFDLMEVYPNPFNPSTTVHYALGEKSDVRIEVMSMDGKTVAVLCNQVQEAGDYRTPFNGSNLTSGTYMVTLSATGKESGMIFNKMVKVNLTK
jgi:hypothetical protein